MDRAQGRAPARVGGGQAAVTDERLDDLIADRVHRIERGHGLLEDHRGHASPERPPLTLVETVHVVVLQLYLAGDARVRWRVEAEDRA